MTLLEQAVSIADTTGNIEPGVKARSGLARAQLQLADPAAALAATTRGGTRRTRRRSRRSGCWKGWPCSGCTASRRACEAFSDAVTAAEALLALADRNVAALYARALALSGLAAATGDPARAPGR